MMGSEMLGPMGNPSYRNYANDIHVSGNHLLDVINDILDISKIEAGRMDLVRRPVRIGELVRAVVRLVEARAHLARVVLDVRLPADLPQVEVDERRLKQALLNLLANAVKFTPEKGTVTVSARRTDGHVVIEIADTGIGMSEAEVAIALQPFRQVDGGLNRRYDGTGLGLPLAKSFVEMHGGTFFIDSRKGAGTRVTVSLPVLQPVAVSLPNAG
jgi:signal transduction histidine kinase